MKPMLQKCSETSLGLLAELSRKTFVDAFKDSNDPHDFETYINTAFDPKQLQKELADPYTAFYLVYLRNTVVGYFKTNVETAQTDVKRSDSMELERIYVLQAYQGQGLGQWILEQVTAQALAKSKMFLWLGVWEKNPGAIRFYRQNGFVKFGTHPYYIGNDKQTDWLMRRILNNPG